MAPLKKTWKDKFPGKITAKDAEAEPKSQRLFPGARK